MVFVTLFASTYVTSLLVQVQSSSQYGLGVDWLVVLLAAPVTTVVVLVLNPIEPLLDDVAIIVAV